MSRRPTRCTTAGGRSANLFADPDKAAPLVADALLIGMGEPDAEEAEEMPPGSVCLRFIVNVWDARVLAGAMYQRSVLAVSAAEEKSPA